MQGGQELRLFCVKGRILLLRHDITQALRPGGSHRRSGFKV